jgi:ribosomal-protein-alanine N-acetyltransferase
MIPLDLVIETMQVKHIDRVAAIEALVYPSPWSKSAFVSEILENTFASYFVALMDGVVVGYAGIWTILDEVHITNLAVHPDNQQQGIGRFLLECLITEALKNGVGRMTLEVRTSNYKAQKLYENYGFINRGLRPKYYNDEDAIIMWLDDIASALQKKASGERKAR